MSILLVERLKSYLEYGNIKKDIWSEHSTTKCLLYIINKEVLDYTIMEVRSL